MAVKYSWAEFNPSKITSLDLFAIDILDFVAPFPSRNKYQDLPCCGYTLEHLLDSGRIASKWHGHLQSLWWDVAHRCLDVVWDPFNEVGRVLVLNVEHLFIHLLGGHASTEESRSSQVATMTRISRTHHVLGIEHPHFSSLQKQTFNSSLPLGNKFHVSSFSSFPKIQNYSKVTGNSFLSSICWVNSGTVSARYCCEPREVNGAKPVMKKCRRGNGTRFTAILRKSQFSWPGKRKQQVTPLMAAETKWFRSP